MVNYLRDKEVIPCIFSFSFSLASENNSLTNFINLSSGLFQQLALSSAHAPPSIFQHNIKSDFKEKPMSDPGTPLFKSLQRHFVSLRGKSKSLRAICSALVTWASATIQTHLLPLSILFILLKAHGAPGCFRKILV